MSSSPEMAPNSEFANAEAVTLRSYKSASIIEVSPKPIESEGDKKELPLSPKLELETVSTQPSEVLVETEPDTVPQKRLVKTLLSISMALLVATLPLAVLVGIEYWPQPQLVSSHPMQALDRVMFNSRMPNLMELLDLYSQKQVNLWFEIGSPVEAITRRNVVSIVLPKPENMDLDVFKLITQVLGYVKPVGVVI